MNQDATILSIASHLIEAQPRRTIEKPIVAPTILCVPEIGILNAVAIIFQAADPNYVNHGRLATMFVQVLFFCYVSGAYFTQTQTIII